MPVNQYFIKNFTCLINNQQTTASHIETKKTDNNGKFCKVYRHLLCIIRMSFWMELKLKT